ncbi:MAG: DUF4838 domain-containing protein [Verrucomicrobia bacterium]|nr:DUF4838 domain-containing protein [Verrucomicrobiota bacterium]
MRTKRRLSWFYFGIEVLLVFAGVNFGLDAATGSAKQAAVASGPAPGPAEASHTPALLPIQVDGQLLEPAWSKAERQTGFVYSWSKRTPPATQFRALVDSERLWFAFEVEDEDIVLAKEFTGESSVDQEDRVEIFFARDAALNRYFCLEIDPLGRVHDYAASSYRKFDDSWNCPGLRTAGKIGMRGYTVEAAIPLQTLSELLGRRISPGASLRVGLFRAEFRKGALGDADENWMSRVKPDTVTPDFHVPSAFADRRLPEAEPAGPEVFRTRGVVLVPEDLSATDWPARAARAGLTTIALHHGTSTEHVASFIESARGQEFLRECARLGLHVEYELHAMRDLLPRDLFVRHPEWFRMDKQGKRTPDANLCVSSELALAIVATNALRLARRLPPTTNRYFFWGDDGLPWCCCASCSGFSDSEQALLLENRIIGELRQLDPGAELAHLSYANTLTPPAKVKPAPGVFLEFAPIHRRYDLPYARQTGPEAKDALSALSANLAVFPPATAQVLEYWLDVSRFSKWNRPAVELPWDERVLVDDAETYAASGVRHVTTFAVWIDADYLKRFGEPVAIQKYGEALRKTSTGNRD